MKLQLRDLPALLNRPLSSLYWLSGDEVFLMNQTLKDLISVAKQQGFEIERESLTSANFSERFFSLTHEFSLFSTQRCIVLTLELKEVKFLEMLWDYVQAKDPSLVVIISTGKLLPSVTAHAEFKRLENLPTGFFSLPIWPIDREHLPTFLINQAKRYQLYLDRDVAQKMAALTEGNLFAADQIFEKLSLCPNSGKISEEDLNQTTESQTRFELFDLTSAALLGDLPRTWQIWVRLQSQKIEPILVLWALVREIRLLAVLHEKSQETSLPELLKQHKFWEKRAKEVNQAFSRLSYSKCLSLLQWGAKIDRTLKGAEPGDPVLLLGEMLKQMCSFLV